MGESADIGPVYIHFPDLTIITDSSALHLTMRSTPTRYSVATLRFRGRVIASVRLLVPVNVRHFDTGQAEGLVREIEIDEQGLAVNSSGLFKWTF